MNIFEPWANADLLMQFIYLFIYLFIFFFGEKNKENTKENQLKNAIHKTMKASIILHRFVILMIFDIQ